MTESCRHCGREIKIAPTTPMQFDWVHRRGLVPLIPDRQCRRDETWEAEPAEMALATWDERMEI